MLRTSLSTTDRVSTNRVRTASALWGALLVLIVSLGGCSKEPAAAAVTAEPVAAESAPVITERPEKTVVVGSMGGAVRLNAQLGAIYSIDFRDGGAWLNGVAVLRGESRGWFDSGADTLPLAMRHPGIGGSLGPHRVVVTPDGKAVWVNDKEKFEFAEGNVALFEGADDQLIYVGERQLESYLGPAPLEDANQRRALVQTRLAGLLSRSAAISGQWPDPS